MELQCWRLYEMEKGEPPEMEILTQMGMEKVSRKVQPHIQDLGQRCQRTSPLDTHSLPLWSHTHRWSYQRLRMRYRISTRWYPQYHKWGCNQTSMRMRCLYHPLSSCPESLQRKAIHQQWHLEWRWRTWKWLGYGLAYE